MANEKTSRHHLWNQKQIVSPKKMLMSKENAITSVPLLPLIRDPTGLVPTQNLIKMGALML